MADDVVISAENLGKKYIIGHQAAERSTTLRDAISQSARRYARSMRDIARGAANVAGDELEEFWALRDVNFEIRRGDVVGVIGRNGAGKSTLLKVLSRITEPSEGRVHIRGRVASLLEVGTGFHPELSGRENVYLNGAILGMGQAEIRRKFDEIVAFAEIEKFLDTPVKRYSSGMYVRLAFAVAAHLEPEILIVDEVLAVGDAEFQKKCLGKMQDVAGHGRTVLFVSHNMGAVQALCDSCILFANGRVQASGAIADVIKKYAATERQSNVFEAPRDPSASVDVHTASVEVEHGPAGLEVVVRAKGVATHPQTVSFDVRLKDTTGAVVGFATSSQIDPADCISLSAGSNAIEMRMDARGLCDGSYFVSIDVSIPNVRWLQRREDCMTFEVRRATKKFGVRNPNQSWGIGSVCLPAETIVMPSRHAAQYVTPEAEIG